MEGAGWLAVHVNPLPYLQVGGGAVVVESASVSLGGAGGGTGGKRAGGGGGGGRSGGGKQRARAVPAVEPVERLPARGMGVARVRGRGREAPEAGAGRGPDADEGEEAEGRDAKKQRSEAESEAEDIDLWRLLPPSRVVKSPLLVAVSAESLEERMILLNKASECVVNANALTELSSSELTAVNGVLKELQQGKEFTHNKRVGWSVADFDLAAQVGVAGSA